MTDRQTAFNNHWSTRWVDFDNDTDTTERRKRIAFEAFDAGWSAALTDEVVQSIRAEARAEAHEEYGDLIRAARATIKATDRVAFAWKVGKCGPLSPKSCYIPDIARALEQLRAALLADEPKEERGEEVGDIVTWTNSHGARMIGIFGREITQGDAIILMRRAEVERRIEEAGHA